MLGVILYLGGGLVAVIVTATALIKEGRDPTKELVTILKAAMIWPVLLLAAFIVGLFTDVLPSIARGLLRRERRGTYVVKRGEEIVLRTSMLGDAIRERARDMKNLGVYEDDGTLLSPVPGQMPVQNYWE